MCSLWVYYKPISAEISKYFSKWHLYVAISQILIYSVYFIFRCNHTGLIIPETGINDDFRMSVGWWTFINTILMILIGVRVTYFLGASSRFLKVINLIYNVNLEIMPFLIYLVLWIIYTSLMFIVAGVIIYDKEFKEEQKLNEVFATFLQNFSNAIGEINFPYVEFWIYENRAHTVWLEMLSKIWAWGLFIVNEFVMLIVLLNFVIALISESYEKVMLHQREHLYTNRAMSNYFISLVLNHEENEPCKIIYLCQNEDFTSSIDTDFEGVTKSIK